MLAIVAVNAASSGKRLSLMWTKSEFLLCVYILSSLMMKIEPALIFLRLTERYCADCKSAVAHTIVWQNLFLKVHKFPN